MSRLEVEVLTEDAKRFLEWNFVPIPLKGKVPIPRKWQNITEEDSLEIIEKYANNLQMNNLGILTGKPSKIVVMDIDIKNQGLEKWEKMVSEHEPLDTFTVRTGSGGLHCYFSYNKKIGDILNISGKGLGVEYKSTGGQVVAPWSLHNKTGIPYTPISGFEQVGKGKKEIKPILSSMPNWLEKYLRKLQEEREELKEESEEE